MNRRDFLGRSTAVALGVGALSGRGASLTAQIMGTLDHLPRRALRILILGGTGFIGPHQVRLALSRGHTLTLFNRGRTNPHLFPDVEKLVGDRDGNLEALKGREWDVVLDNSGFEPRIVRDSAELLADAVGQYLFVSTQAVYADRSIVDQDETGAVGITGMPAEEWDGYGPLKALCEREVRAVFGERSTMVRPPVIVGPGDNSDRFTYWVDRVDRGGEMLAPGKPDDATQFVDVRDLTEWMIRCVEEGITGTYNTTGPEAPLTMAGLLYAIWAVTASPVRFTWVDAEFLNEHGVRPFSDIPIWYPPVGPTAAFMRMNASRAQAQGLTYRPLAVTVAETLEWSKSRPTDRRANLRAGLSPDREAELLAAWHARSRDRSGP